MSIKNIAKQVGCSPATVSRVLNNPEYHCSDEKLREKIWKVAMELDYVPNEAARKLKLGKGEERQKTFFINVLVTRMDDAGTDPFFSELLRVIESEIHRNFCILTKVWYASLFSDEKKCEKSDLEKIIREMFGETQDKSDGLVIIGKCSKKALAIWQKHYKSIVSVNRNSTNYQVDEVLCDGEKIAKKAVECLISLGHERIGYVGEYHKEARYQGYIDTLKKHGLEFEPEDVIYCKQTEVAGFEAMQWLSQQENPPTGLYCANDIIAIGMLKYLDKYKNRMYRPSIVASDDIEQAQNTSPMLTTVRLPREEMGRFAVRLLVDRMKGDHSSIVRMELEGKLMVRGSATPVK